MKVEYNNYEKRTSQTSLYPRGKYNTPDLQTSGVFQNAN